MIRPTGAYGRRRHDPQDHPLHDPQAYRLDNPPDSGDLR